MQNIFRYIFLVNHNILFNNLLEGNLKFLLFILLSLITLTSYAQQKAVTGIITEAESRKPLPGSTVAVKGSTRGTTANNDGLFSLVISEGETLVFSLAGFTPQEVIVGRETMLEIRLIQQVSGLDKVVVMGYGQVKRKDATGAVLTIGSDYFNPGAAISPQELIAGRISGVNTTSAGGSPGEGFSIHIRGVSSLFSGSNPLIVVNGMPLANDGISGMKNPLVTINPYDIESISVLKDASETAIYGSRGSNGVVLITTKKGRVGAPLSLTYNGYMTLGTHTSKMGPLTADAFRSLLQERYANNPDALNLQGYDNTDWQSEIYRPSIGYNHHFSATGNILNFPFRASVGYTDQQGILDTDGMNRLTATLVFNPSFFEEHLHLNLNVKSMLLNNQFGNRRAISSAFGFDPTQPVRNESPYGGYFTWTQEDGSPIIFAGMNPVAQLKLRDENSNVMRSLGSAGMDYRFHYFPDLTANLNLGYDVSAGNGLVMVQENAPWIMNITGGEGKDSRYTQDKRNTLIEFYLNFVKTSGITNSEIDALAGYSLQHFWKTGIFQSFKTHEIEENSYTRFETEHNITSFFGRLNYRYKERVFATFSLRQDGLSKHSVQMQRGFFPAVAMAWLISDGLFLSGIRLLSELKLRIGYGVTGQPDMSDNDFSYIPQYTFWKSNAPSQYENAFHQSNHIKVYHANMSREETEGYNIGLDYGFLDNRVAGSVDVYYRFTDNLVNYIPISHGTNFISKIITNEGSLENRGIEFSADIVPILKLDIRWDIGFNLSYNENKIVRLTDIYYPDYFGIETGAISGGVGNTIQIHKAGYPASSFFVFEQIYNEYGMPVEWVYVDRNSDGGITVEDRYIYKKAAPDVVIGFYSDLKYQNWEFRLNGRVSINNYVYNNVWSAQGIFSNLYNQAGFLNNISRNVFDSGFHDAQYFSDYYVRNASFLRLDNISAGYTFRKLKGEVLQMKVYGTFQNVFVLTGYKGTDPEISDGIDNHIYPRPRAFQIGITLHY